MYNTLDVNSINLRNMYPTALGTTTSQSGSTTSQQRQSDMIPNGQAQAVATPVDQAVMIGGQGSAVIAGIVFLALLVGLMFFAKWLGNSSDFAGIRPSAYNVLVISLAAVVGLPIWKYLFTRFPVPGLSTWVLAS